MLARHSARRKRVAFAARTRDGRLVRCAFGVGKRSFARVAHRIGEPLSRRGCDCRNKFARSARNSRTPRGACRHSPSRAGHTRRFRAPARGRCGAARSIAASQRSIRPAHPGSAGMRPPPTQPGEQAQQQEAEDAARADMHPDIEAIFQPRSRANRKSERPRRGRQDRAELRR